MRTGGPQGCGRHRPKTVPKPEAQNQRAQVGVLGEVAVARPELHRARLIEGASIAVAEMCRTIAIMFPHTDVQRWFATTSGFPFDVWEDVDEELADLAFFARGDLLDVARRLVGGSAAGPFESKSDLRLHLAAALFFYLGHATATGGHLSDFEHLLTGAPVDEFCEDPGVYERPAMQQLVEAVLALATDFVSPLWEPPRQHPH